MWPATTIMFLGTFVVLLAAAGYWGQRKESVPMLTIYIWYQK
jgi:hypothetical protein